MKEQPKKIQKTRAPRSKKINVEKELAKVEQELKKISASTQELRKQEPKKTEIKNQVSHEELPELPDIQLTEQDFPEEFSSRASRLFTAPILLPSGQEKIDNLEEFAALAPSSREAEDESPNYAAGKKNYGDGDAAAYANKVDNYSEKKNYASDNSPASQSSPRVISPFIKEDFTTGRRQEMQPASGMDTSKSGQWEDKSKLEEFTRIQQYESNKRDEEERSRKKRG